MADWLARTTQLQPDWRNLAVTAGGQQAVALALGSLASPGDAILTEAGTYYGLRTLAEHAGYRLKGVCSSTARAWSPTRSTAPRRPPARGCSMSPRPCTTPPAAP